MPYFHTMWLVKDLNFLIWDNFDQILKLRPFFVIFLLRIPVTRRTTAVKKYMSTNRTTKSRPKNKKSFQKSVMQWYFPNERGFYLLTLRHTKKMFIFLFTTNYVTNTLYLLYTLSENWTYDVLPVYSFVLNRLSGVSTLNKKQNLVCRFHLNLS